MRTIKYERLDITPAISENPFKVYAAKSAILRVGSLTLVDTGLRFPDIIDIKVVKPLSDPIAVIGVCWRNTEVWVALSLYDRVDGMSIGPGCPLAVLNAQLPSGPLDATEMRFIQVKDGKRVAICGSNAIAETPQVIGDQGVVIK